MITCGCCLALHKASPKRIKTFARARLIRFHTCSVITGCCRYFNRFPKYSDPRDKKTFENVGGGGWKGENAGNQHFLPFPNDVSYSGYQHMFSFSFRDQFYQSKFVKVYNCWEKKNTFENIEGKR